MERNCVLLGAKESFSDAAKDLEQLTGLKVSKSTIHRQALGCEIPAPETKKVVTPLAVDGGNIRVRTPLGEPSIWKKYKAIQFYNDVGFACFQNDRILESWINEQPMGRVVNCLGDRHKGIWNLINNIGDRAQRREVLDWYHLQKNLDGIGGSIKRLRRAETHLWHGDIEAALAEFNRCKGKQKRLPNFRSYLYHHQKRIPDYS